MAMDKKKVKLGFRVRFPFVSVSFSYPADDSSDIADTVSVSVSIYLCPFSCVSVSSFCVNIKSFLEPTCAACKRQISSIHGKHFFSFFRVLQNKKTR